MRHQESTKRKPAAAGVMGWVLALGVLTVVFTLPFLWIAFVQSENEFLGEAQIFHGTISRHVNHSETVLTGFTTLYQALEAPRTVRTPCCALTHAACSAGTRTCTSFPSSSAWPATRSPS